MGILVRIGLDGAIPPLVLLFAMHRTVQSMAAVDRLPTLLAQPLRLLRLGLDDPSGTDPGPIDDLPHPLPRDPELLARFLQVVQLLIPLDHLLWVDPAQFQPAL